MKIAIPKCGRRAGCGFGNRSVAGAAIAVALFPSVTPEVSAGTRVNFTTGTGLRTASNYSSGALPTNTTDVQITTTSTLLQDNGNSSLQMESLNLTNSSPETDYGITNENSTTNSVLTLGNSAGFANAYSGAANDLIYLQNTNLTIYALYNTGGPTLGLALASSGNFDVTSGSTLAISAVISGNYGITNSGAGTLILSGTNTFSGAFGASAGTVELEASGALGNVSTVNISGSALVYDAVLSLTNVINSSAALSLSGTGVLQTEGSAQTVGSLTGTSGTKLYIGDYVNGGTTTAGSFTVGDSTASTTYAGTIIGTYSETGALLTKQGTGTLILSGANTFTGAIAINGGNLQVASTETAGTSGPLGASGTISFGGGTLQYSSANQFDYSSRFSQAANQAYSVDTNGQNVTFASALTSSGGTLLKIGAGTLTLSGTNTYNSTTAIAGGTLIVNGDNSAATGAVSVGNGTTLTGTLGGTGTIGGATTVRVGSTITGGTVGTVGTLTITNPLTINGTYVADVAPTTSDKLSLTGSSTAGSLSLGTGSALNLVVSGTLTAAQYVLATYASLSGTFGSVSGTPTGYKLDYGTVTAGAITLDMTPVPEPATWLGGALLTGFVGYSQRRRLQGLLLAAIHA